MPVERTHGEIVVFSVPDRELLLEVLKGIEFMGSVKVFVVLTVASLDLTVVSGRIRLDEFMPNAELLQRCF